MEELKIRLDNRIRFSKEELPPEGIALLKKRLTFNNPLYERNERFGKPNFGIDPTLRCIWEDQEKGEIALARGFLPDLVRILHKNRIGFELIDDTLKFKTVGFDSRVGTEALGMTQPFHFEALEAMTKECFGIVVGPLGFGLKMLACKLTARRQVPALVIVKTKREAYIWKEKASQYLKLGPGDIGLIGDGHRDLGKSFTIAITLTLWKVLDQVEPQTGFLIVDQCNLVSLKVYFKAGLFRCPFMLGLGTSPKRSGGLTGLMNAYLGPRIYQIYPDYDRLEETRPLVKVRPTSFDYSYQDDWSEMITALCQDEGRNGLIVTDILQETANPKTKALVISERIGHLEDLKGRIEAGYGEAGVITGETSPSKREEIARRFARGRLQVVLIPFKSVPSLEIKGVNRLFVASPVKYGDYMAHVTGRLLTPEANNGHSVIFDYQDKPEPLRASLKRRLKIYQTMGVSS